MFIKRLEIFGFKSFKNKTVLEFDNLDITGVVGPNGCGKSNIVDALLWVMGESSPKHLRGDSLSDVIFGGTSKEAPGQIAEVKMILGKGKREFPENYKEFSEIMITRRAYRDGKNEYLINEQACLLRDIKELFMNTGAGCRGFSIIEQESIERLITAKPAQRQYIIEEVAGITKFKNRKNESRRKLDLVNQNLKRLDDILNMQNSQLSQLASQAKKADKYKKLKQDIEVRQKQIYSLAYKQLITEQNNTSQQIEHKEQDQINKEQEKKETIEKNQKIVSQEELLQKSIEKFSQEITARKIKSANLKEKGKIIEMIDQFNEKIDRINEKKENIKKELQTNQAELNNFKDFFQGNFTLENIEQAEIQLKKSLEDIKQNKNSLSSNIDILNNQIQFVGKEIESLIQEEKDLQGKIKENINHKSSALSLIKKENQNKILIKEKIQKLNESESQTLSKKSSLEKEKNQLKSSISVLTHKIDEMKKLIGQFENINQGADDLIKWNPEEFSSLFQNLKVDPQYTTALSSILGPYIESIIPKENNSLEKGIERLKNIKKGKTSFLSELPSLKIDNTIREELKSYPACICFLDEKINWNLKNSNLKPFLEQTAVVSNLKSAFELKKQFPSFQFVTLDGDFINRDSIVHAGSAEANTSLFKIRDQIENGNSELSQKKIELKTKEIQHSACLEQFTALTEELVKSKQKLTEISNIINSSHQDIDFIEKDNLRLSEIRDKNHSKQKDFKIKQASLLEHQTTYNQEIKKWEESLSVKNSYLKALERALEKLKEQNNLEQEELMLSNIINQSKNSNQILSNSDLKKDTQNNQEEIENFEQKLQRSQAELKQCQIDREQNAQDIKNIEHNVFQIKLDINNLSAEQDKKEIEKTHLKSKFFENYQLQLEDFEQQEIDKPLEKLQEEVQKYEQQLDRIKEVNFLALEEYEKLSKENFFLNEQKEDLVNSKTEILKVISHIDKICNTRFHDMLEEINKRFSKVFPIVFQGDNAKAELILHEDQNTKETGVDILIHPPGKRPQSVSLLSRGEKALTSICLIYSLFLVKPSPFCIIDEADAPLDDANIFRFLSVLKEMSRTSQIIAITHNKYTMQSCRKLYGVTQEQPGISQIVSVDSKNNSIRPEQNI